VNSARCGCDRSSFERISDQRFFLANIDLDAAFELTVISL
jgi:hypothetical protein